MNDSDNFVSGRRWGLAAAGISGVAVYLNGFAVAAWAELGGPAAYTTAKNLIAAGLLIFLFSKTDTRMVSPSVTPSMRHRIGLVVVAVVGGSLPFLLFFEGLARSASTQAGFIHKTLVVWVALLALPLLGERLRWPHVGAIGLLVGGQIVLAGGISDLAAGSGELLILAATWLWAVEVIVVKRLLAVYTPSVLAMVRMAGGAALLILYGLVSGLAIPWASVGATQIGWVLITGAVLAGFVFTWLTALARSPAIDVTAILVGGAVVTGVLAQGVAVVSPPTLAGFGLVLAGVAMFLRSPRSVAVVSPR